MFWILFISTQAASYIVNITDLNSTQDHAVLYTSSSLIQQSFINAVQFLPFQCVHILCESNSSCPLPSLSVTLNSKQFPYTWSYTYTSFSEFFQKITSAAVINISCSDSYELLSSKQISFLFTYSTETEFYEFNAIAESLKTSHMYFGAAFNQSFDKKKKIQTPELVLLGVDGIYKHSTSSNYLGFINEHKCPSLLEYQDSSWVEACLTEKIVVTSVLNKRRKHMWNLYGGKLKVLAQELNDSSFQMMYVDSRKSEEYLKKYEIPFFPFVLIHDNRVNKSFYLGEFSLKTTKKLLKFFHDIKNHVLDPENYTLADIQYTKYLNFWQIFPLLFLLFGLLLLTWICYRKTFTKEKTN